MSAYKTKVEGTTGLLYYLPLKLNSGTAAVGGVNATLTSTTSGAAGQGPLESPATDEGTTLFNGTSGTGQTGELTLSATTISVEFWLYWTTNGTNDDFAMEGGANANNTTGFNFDWNNSTSGETAGAGTVSIKANYGGSGKDRRYTIVRPSAAAHHHVVAVFTAATKPIVYIDGAAVTATNREVTNSQSGNFGKLKVTLMNRQGASLNGAGRLSDVAFYEGEISKANVEAHYAARKEAEGGGDTIAVVPAAFTISLSGLAVPVALSRPAPPAAAIGLAANAPAGNTYAAAVAGAIAAAGNAPAATTTAPPSAASIAATANAPTWASVWSPSPAVIGLVAAAPATSTTAAPGVAAIGSAGIPPVAKTTLPAPIGAIGLSSNAPAPSTAARPGAASISAAPQTPTPKTIAAAALALVALTAYAPVPTAATLPPGAAVAVSAPAPALTTLVAAVAAQVALTAPSPVPRTVLVPASAVIGVSAPAPGYSAAVPPVILKLPMTLAITAALGTLMLSDDGGTLEIAPPAYELEVFESPDRDLEVAESPDRELVVSAAPGTLEVTEAPGTATIG